MKERLVRYQAVFDKLLVVMFHGGLLLDSLALWVRDQPVTGIVWYVTMLVFTDVFLRDTAFVSKTNEDIL